MFSSKFALSVATVVALATAAGAALAEVPESTGQAPLSDGVTMAQGVDRPVLSHYRIVSVSPFVEQRTHIHRTWNELQGAVIRVEAQPGLTAQWLQVRVNRELVAMQSHPMANDTSPLAVPGVRASVSPVADGFVITLATNDRGDAARVLQRAEALRTVAAR